MANMDARLLAKVPARPRCSGVRSGLPPARRDLEHQRHRAVVDQGHAHARPEDALLRAQPLAEAVIQRLRRLRPRCLDVAGAVAAAGVAVEGELADAENLALVQ